MANNIGDRHDTDSFHGALMISCGCLIALHFVQDERPVREKLSVITSIEYNVLKTANTYEKKISQLM